MEYSRVPMTSAAVRSQSGPSGPKSRINARAWWMVGVFFLTTFISYTDRLILSALVDPIRADPGLSDSAVGFAAAITAAQVKRDQMPLADIQYPFLQTLGTAHKRHRADRAGHDRNRCAKDRRTTNEICRSSSSGRRWPC
jgi:hypothetical protein